MPLIGGIAVFAASPTPTPDTPRVAGFETAVPAPSTRMNWASLAHGARVRVSGWDRFRSHHPLFLIDGERRPTPREKWTTLPGRHVAWLEVRLARRRDVDELVLRHAAWRERGVRPHARYRARCLRGSEALAELRVEANRDAVARHPLVCPGTDRVRIEFDTGGAPDDRVRLYEVEAWGSTGEAA